jgi:hypothetical protein
MSIELSLGIGITDTPLDRRGASGPGAGVDNLLLETGDALLLETGDALLLE